MGTIFFAIDIREFRNYLNNFIGAINMHKLTYETETTDWILKKILRFCLMVYTVTDTPVDKEFHDQQTAELIESVGNYLGSETAAHTLITESAIIIHRQIELYQLHPKVVTKGAEIDIVRLLGDTLHASATYSTLPDNFGHLPAFPGSVLNSGRSAF